MAKPPKATDEHLTFKGNDGNQYKLTLKEKLFCERYLEFYGNGTEAAFEVFDCKNMKVAASVAYEYLRKPEVIAYVDLKLEEFGFSDDNVKKQHLFTLNQFADLSSKNKAIDMFYKLKGLYAPEQVQHSLNESDIDEQITRVRAELGAVRASKDKTQTGQSS